MEKAWNIERERDRSNCYKLLAACFYEPDYDAFTGEKLFANLANGLDCINADAADNARAMGKAFSLSQMEAITVAHAKLFIGPFELAAPPYGSVYLEEGKQMMGETTVAVQQMYQSSGLSLRGEMRDAPDHIAFELEFMHYLSDRMLSHLAQGEMDAASKMLALQREFNENYLAGWVDKFCEMIIANSAHEFYNLVGKCLSSFYKSAVIPDKLPDQI